MWAQIASTAVGLWLMVAPAVLGYSGAARTNDHITGPVAASLSVIAVAAVTRGVRWGLLPIGIWLVIAPWLLGYDSVPTINSIAVGIALAILAPFGGNVERQYGGGWRSLLPGRNLADPPARSSE
jgi:hypothetical protein